MHASLQSMPIRAALALFANLVAAGFVTAQTSPATKPAVEASAAVIEGLEIPRANGTFLGVRLQGVQLKITFYDAKKKKVAADAVRIAARWQDHKPRRAVLLPSDSSTLLSPPVFKQPYDYRIFLLLIGANDSELESLQINPALLPRS